jgi:glycine C-acetyltransferase
MQYGRQHRKFIGRLAEVEDLNGRIWHGINGASQDYLGLSSHSQVIASAKEAIDRFGAHSCGAAALGGGISLSKSVEEQISSALGLKHVCLFPTGWAAGYGVIYGLIRRRDHIIIDGLAHNCLQHGAIASTPNVRPFIHNDMASLRRRLERIRNQTNDGAILIITEGLFSVDSDSPDFRELVSLKNEFNAHILLDIAHDFGCLGPHGIGAAADQISYDDIDFVIGSFSKTFASIGGFFATNCLPSKRAVQGFSGSYTYSNYLIPSQLGAIDAAISIVFSEEGDRLRALTLGNTIYLRRLLSEGGLNTIGRSSALTIVVVGSEAIARVAYKRLLESGIILNCIESPVVRKGDARFRIQLTPHHTKNEIEAIADGLISALRVEGGSSAISQNPEFLAS